MSENREFTITDGMVEYKHSKPLGEYDNKTPVVRLSYQIAEGSDPGLVTAKVMGIAIEIVERAILTNLIVQQGVEQEPTAVEPQKSRGRGRPPVNPVSEPVIQPDAAAIVDEAEPEVKPVTEPDPASMAGVDAADEDADLGIVVTEQQPAEPELTLADIQAQAQKVSAHLRKEFQHVNDLRKLIASCQAPGTENGTLLTIPQDKRYDFMQKSKGLLAMKK